MGVEDPSDVTMKLVDSGYRSGQTRKARFKDLSPRPSFARLIEKPQAVVGATMPSTLS